MIKISLNDIKERLSTSTILYYNFAPIDEKAIRKITEAGISKIELLESPQQFDMSDKDSMQHIINTCRSFGVSIVAYHSHFVKPHQAETEMELNHLIDKCKRQIDTLQEAGGDIWASHAMKEDNKVYLFHEKLLRYIEKTNVKLAIENFTRKGVWVEDRLNFLKKLDHHKLGFLLDIGHVRNDDGVNPMTLPGGPSQILQKCAGKLVHIHLHGFKQGMDHYPPLCEGDEIQWKELFNQLWATDYQGYLNFESKGMPMYDDTLSKVSKMPEEIMQMITK